MALFRLRSEQLADPVVIPAQWNFYSAENVAMASAVVFYAYKSSHQPHQCRIPRKKWNGNLCRLD